MWPETNCSNYPCWPRDGHKIKFSIRKNWISFEIHWWDSFMSHNNLWRKKPIISLFLPQIFVQPSPSLSTSTFILILSKLTPKPLWYCLLLIQSSTFSLCFLKKPQDKLINLLPLDHLASTTKEKKMSHHLLEAIVRRNHQEKFKFGSYKLDLR